MPNMSMTELVRTFWGRVDLADPTCGIYILEGLRSLRQDVTLNEYDNANTGMYFVIGGVGGKAVGEENMLLARVVARGPKTSIFAPKLACRGRAMVRDEEADKEWPYERGPNIFTRIRFILIYHCCFF